MSPKEHRPNQIKNNGPARKLRARPPSQIKRIRTEIGLRGPSASLELPAEASATKVSKPVLFMLKMTDFQYTHKTDSNERKPRGSRKREKGALGPEGALFEPLW